MFACVYQLVLAGIDEATIRNKSRNRIVQVRKPLSLKENHVQDTNVMVHFPLAADLVQLAATARNAPIV